MGGGKIRHIKIVLYSVTFVLMCPIFQVQLQWWSVQEVGMFREMGVGVGKRIRH